MAVVEFAQDHPSLAGARCAPYPPALRRELDVLLARRRRPEAAAIVELDAALGRFFAESCLTLLRDLGVPAAAVRAIGSHGQTVWHEPGGADPLSLQLGAGALIAELTGIDTVCNFRAADVAAHGQGAPLAPLLHRRLFAAPGETLAVLNLGGIANLTLLEPGGAVRGWDTGPANCLLDLWSLRHTGRPFDAGGAWAAGGLLLQDLLEGLLADPYFGLPAPKSTGLEYFNDAWLAARGRTETARPRDVQRTLAELTAASVAASLPDDPAPARLLVCGGGVHNEFLMARLRALLPGMPVESTATRGVDPDWVEATLFAWLARERLLGRAQDTASITGAQRRVLLGDIHRA